MIRIGQLKLNPDHSKKDLIQKIAKTLRISETEIIDFQIKKQSLDARKKPELKYVYTVDVKVRNEGQILNKQKNNQIALVNESKYVFPVKGEKLSKHRTVIIG